jgi:hypothetical protein
MQFRLKLSAIGLQPDLQRDRQINRLRRGLSPCCMAPGRWRG